ncbi:SDR family NAD(P)-dependent oxidoreductase [Aquibaculum arenosum]|uniref:SDR family oxidoreductase n=1 Tax=Aquibaculum arenosum TaxID=3032591 RepID=A0ABT5YNM3_9PROT|nr:SDR family oxidoreductase [Fodinicurvata sp. CAU 1616]MDF2096571.1 SDR family oxidoreductase [Fodinicurvata sp. CAU 1616]
MFSPENFSLQGRRALVIGGAGGIGLALARGFVASGATVLLAGRDEAKLQRGESELGQVGAGPFVYTVDARSVSALETLAETVEREHGGLDILINCQGTTAIKPALELSESEWDAIIDTNLKSAFFACLAFGRRMLAHQRGAIINITSLAAHYGWANAAAYSASKMGLSGITQSLAAEWGEQGVRVNAIAPGFFMTDLNRERMPEARKEEARKRAAMKRMGELDELVGAAVYLASDASAFVNGTTLRVDGGYLSSGI